MGDRDASLNILFVCRGNKAYVISPIIKAQAESLEAAGQKVTIYPLEGKGRLLYFKNILRLKEFIRKGNYDIVHAHYGFSGITCTLAASRKRLVVSLMGSEMYRSVLMRKVYRIFSGLLWARTIIKTEAMARLLRSPGSEIIPNGVNLDLFHPIDKLTARQRLGLNSANQILLFPSYTFRKEKNYQFIKRVVEERFSNTQLLNFDADPPEIINLKYNAADVVVMASLFEGSPNAIKEAMACNRPIVATDVGDISIIISDTPGCFISELNESDYEKKINQAIAFSRSGGSTTGRERIARLNLDSVSVANRLISLYKQVISLKGV